MERRKTKVRTLLDSVTLSNPVKVERRSQGQLLESSKSVTLSLARLGMGESGQREMTDDRTAVRSDKLVDDASISGLQRPVCFSELAILKVDF